MIFIHHALPHVAIGIGVLRASGITPRVARPRFDQALDALLQQRQHPLDEAQDAVRRAARDMLRNGAYKPTGRGKPASEYLLRAAARTADDPGAFPRINGPVDICNFISLMYLVPISLWDLDRSESDRYVFRLGREDEAYVFNSAGQTIKLADLVVGCCVEDGAIDGVPIVNPVKDSMLTKTTPETTRVAACIYAPLQAVPPEQLEEACARFAEHLTECGPDVEVAWSIVLPGQEAAV